MAKGRVSHCELCMLRGASHSIHEVSVTLICNYGLGIVKDYCFDEKLYNVDSFCPDLVGLVEMLFRTEPDGV